MDPRFQPDETTALMARSDLLVGLVKAASRSDDQGFRRALEALVADERGKHHHVLADRLAEYLGPSTNGFHVMVPPTTTDEGIAEVLHSRRAQRTLESLTLPDSAVTCPRASCSSDRPATVRHRPRRQSAKP